VRLLAAPDKFRGSLSAREAADAIARGAAKAGWGATVCPLSDGGEGFRSVFDGQVIAARVHGPLGHELTTSFTLDGTTAIIEMADAAGRKLLLDPTGHDPVDASTRGVGELIAAALDHGATKIIVGCGGSATTDGGLGAVEILEKRFDPDRCELIVATDVRSGFVDAAALFAPQKGATGSQVELLAARLSRVADGYRSRLGVDVTKLEGAGAAGGLAGGLAALGGRIVSGFDIVADSVGLDQLLAGVDLVVTGEGGLDATTFEGKTVASVIARVSRSRPILVLAGTVDPDLGSADERPELAGCTLVSLVEQVGLERSLSETGAAIEEIVEAFLIGRGGPLRA
jgi:glycerate kinase